MDGWLLCCVVCALHYGILSVLFLFARGAQSCSCGLEEQNPLNYFVLIHPYLRLSAPLSSLQSWMNLRPFYFLPQRSLMGHKPITTDVSPGVERQITDCEKRACLLTWRQSLSTRKGYEICYKRAVKQNKQTKKIEACLTSKAVCCRVRWT